MSGRILRTYIESYMGITDIDIVWDPNASIVALIADGGRCKSSLINFVRSTLSTYIPDEAINTLTGKAKGFIELERNGQQYVIDISKTKNSETVTLKYADGSKKVSKEAVQKLIGNVDINPFELKKMDPAKQFQWFKKTLGIDTREIQEERKKVYSSRTQVNHRIRTLKQQLAPGEDYPEALDVKAERLAEEKHLGDLPQVLKDAIETNLKIARAEQDEANLLVNFTRLDSEISDIEEQIRHLQEKKDSLSDQRMDIARQAKKKREWISHTPVQDTAMLQQQIDAIHRHNSERLEFLNYIERKKEMEESLAQAAQMTSQIQEFHARERKAISEKVLQLEGMELVEPTLDEEGNVIQEGSVVFDKKPFSILSTTDAIKFVMRLRRAIQADVFPILILDDFDLVGSEGRAELIKLCQQEGYSALVAIMDPTEPTLKIIVKNDLNFDPKDPNQKALPIKKKTLTQAQSNGH